LKTQIASISPTTKKRRREDIRVSIIERTTGRDF